MTLDFPGTGNTLDRASLGCNKPDRQEDNSKRTSNVLASKKIIVTIRDFEVNISACSVIGQNWVRSFCSYTVHLVRIRRTLTFNGNMEGKYFGR